MAIIVRVEDNSLLFAGGEVDEGRPLGEADRARLDALAAQYRKLREAEDGQGGLLALGRELYRWLDGDAGWLRRALPAEVAPLGLEVRGPLRPDGAGWTVLQAPWEVLADGQGFLAADPLLGFSPARRLGAPATAAPLGDFRLGLMFMAGLPRGVQPELNFEAEEDAILRAAGQPGIDLVVEDSGDPERLAERLAELPTIPVLHLSCHGHNAWRGDGKPGRPVLLLEDEEGHERPTEAGALVGTLGAQRPRLLFLSACLTAAAAGKDAGGGVAHSLTTALVSAGVPAVLGWDGSVGDSEASAFAHELYKALARRQPLAQAAGTARQQLLGGERPRDWHLARLWLGPQGGGPVVAGQKKRLLASPEHGHKEFLDRRGQRSPVASREAFVGRRRELQEALRELRGQDHGGVLLHGMGRLGKSSLAARIAHRRPDLALAVVYERYDALAVLDALAEGLKDVKPARELLAEARPRVKDAAGALDGVLLDLLSGPCAQPGDKDHPGRPVLLVIDDLERILEPGEGGRHGVQPVFVPVLRAVLRAFDPERTDSRLVLTSRFLFALPDEAGGRDLAARLHALQLPPMTPPARRKLTLRQRQEAGAQPAAERLADTELAARQPLLERAGEVARGNPGLQDLLARLVLAPQGTRAQGEQTLAEMEDYIARGDRPDQAELNAFLENLALEKLVGLAEAPARELLRRALLFEHPVPGEALAALADGGTAGLDQLLALGLLDHFEDVVDSTRPAYAVNDLARPRAGALMDFERAELAAKALPPLFAAWGGADSEKRKTYGPEIELTRLALLCENAEVTAACAADAVDGLEVQFAYRRAAEMGVRAIALLDARGMPVPLALLRRAGEVNVTIGEVDIAEACYARGLKRIEDRQKGELVEPFEKGALTLAQARLLARKGEPDRALPLFERARELFRQQGGKEISVAVTLGAIAELLADKGEVDQALALHRQELKVYEALDDRRSRAATLNEIARLLAAQGEVDQALTLHQRALDAYEALGDRRSRAATLCPIGRLLAAKGEVDQALALHREHLAVMEALGEQRERAIALGDIARLLAVKGEVDQALALHREGLAIMEALGDRRSRAVTLGDIARLLANKGEVDQALALHRQALEVYEALGERRSRAVTLGDIARLLAAKGDVDQALALHEARREINRELGNLDGQAAALWDIAQIELSRGNIADAAPKVAEAYALFDHIGRLDGLCAVGTYHGQVLVAAGEREQGLAVLRRSEAGFRKLGRPAEAEQVQELIRHIETQAPEAGGSGEG